MTPITNIQNICNYTAEWHVCLSFQSEGHSLELTADDNTFECAMQRFFQCHYEGLWNIEADEYDTIELCGEYTVGQEHKEFCFRVNDLDDIKGAMHYCFAKGRITVADLMAWACHEEEAPEHYQGNNIDLPLTAFTAGSKFLDLMAA